MRGRADPAVAGCLLRAKEKVKALFALPVLGFKINAAISLWNCLFLLGILSRVQLTSDAADGYYHLSRSNRGRLQNTGSIELKLQTGWVHQVRKSCGDEGSQTFACNGTRVMRRFELKALGVSEQQACTLGIVSNASLGLLSQNRLFADGHVGARHTRCESTAAAGPRHIVTGRLLALRFFQGKARLFTASMLGLLILCR